MDSTTLPGPGRLLSEAWQVFTTNFGRLLAISLFPALIGLGVGFFAVIIGFIFGLLGLASSNPAMWLFISPVFFVIFIAFIILLSWSQLALFQAIKFILSSSDWTISSAFKTSWPKVFSFCWISVLEFLAVFGGLSLLLIPGLIFMLWFYFCQFVLVEENIGGITALLKSKAYLSGRFFAVLGRLLILGLIILGINAIAWPLSIIPIVGSLVSMAVQIVGTIFTLVYSYIIFNYLRQISPLPNFTPSTSSKVLLSLACLAGLAVPVIFLLGAIFINANKLPTVPTPTHSSIPSLDTSSLIVITRDNPIDPNQSDIYLSDSIAGPGTFFITLKNLARGSDASNPGREIYFKNNLYVILEKLDPAKRPGYSTSELWKYDSQKQGTLLYSITNMFGFDYDVSPDSQYIAILNKGESMGDETFTLTRSNGQLVKDFSSLKHQYALRLDSWSNHIFTLHEGEPDTPNYSIDINADTLTSTRTPIQP